MRQAKGDADGKGKKKIKIKTRIFFNPQQMGQENKMEKIKKKIKEK